AGGVEHGADLTRKMCGRLQEQRALTDAWLAAQQHQRAGHDATAEHTIELVDPGREAHAARRFNLCVQLGRRCSRELRVAAAAGGGSRIGDALLDERVPRAALVAASHPLGRLSATLLTDEDGFRRLHDSWLWALGFGLWAQSYCLSTRVPRRQTISQGIVPIAAAISRASICCQLSLP